MHTRSIDDVKRERGSIVQQRYRETTLNGATLNEDTLYNEAIHVVDRWNNRLVDAQKIPARIISCAIKKYLLQRIVKYSYFKILDAEYGDILKAGVMMRVKYYCCFLNL